MKKNSSTAHNSTFSRVVCMLLVTVLLCGLGWTGIVASAESMQAGSAVSEQIADNMTEGAVETEQPAPTEAPEHMGELPTLDEALGLVAAPQGQPADGVYYFGEQTDTDGLYVKVEVIDKSEGAVLPEGAQLKLKASEKAAEYVRQSILKKAELADDEFFFLYDLSFVDKDGKEIDVGTGSGKSFKVTVYMAGEGNNFADAEGSLNVVSLPYTIGELETAEDIKLEEAEKKAADEPQTEDKPAETEPAQTEQPAAEEKAEPVTEDKAEEPAPAEEPAKAEEADEAKAEEKVEEKAEEKTEETEKSVIPARETKVVVSDLLKVEVSYVFNTNGLGVFAFYGKKDMGRLSNEEHYNMLKSFATYDEFVAFYDTLDQQTIDGFNMWMENNGKTEEVETIIYELLNENKEKEETENVSASLTDNIELAPVSRRSLVRRSSMKHMQAVNNDYPEWPNPGSIKLDKDAEAVSPQDGIDLWEVTLGIQGKNYPTTSDVVLVLDNSGSMYLDGSNSYNTNADRIKNTRAAAAAFVNKLLTDGSTTRIALVVYGTTVQESTQFYNYSNKDELLTKIADIKRNSNNQGTNQQAGIHEAQSILSSSASTGKLKNIVILSDGEPTYSYKLKGTATGKCSDYYLWVHHNTSVDASTLNITGCDYNKRLGSGSSFELSNDYRFELTLTCEHGESETGNYSFKGNNNGIATIWEANQAKAAGTSIYSVSLMAGDNGEATLKSCASDSKYYYAIGANDDMETKLKDAFEAIAGNIAIAAQNGVVGDTMGDKVDLFVKGTDPVITNDINVYNAGNADIYISQGTASYDKDSYKINWNVGNVKEGDNPIMKYKVKIRDGVQVENKEVIPTNKLADFNYKNYLDHDANQEFPIPKVTLQGGTILVHYYRVNEDGLPVNAAGTVVDTPALAMQVKTAEYYSVDGSTALEYKTYVVQSENPVGDWKYYGSYNLNDGGLTVGDFVSVTLTAQKSNQHVWFAYIEKPKTTDITVQKLVKGNFGDINKLFKFEYSFVDIDGKTVTGDFELADKATHVISDVPIDGTLTLTEKNANGYTVEATYDVSTNPNPNSVAVNDFTVNITVEEGKDKVTVTNTRNTTPDTGVSLDSLPYIIVLAAVAVAAVVIILRKRRNNDD